MSVDRQKEFSQALGVLFKGDIDAINFCLMLNTLSQAIDDLIDCDVKVTEYQVIHAFYLAMFDIQTNPFYKKHCDKILPVMKSSYLAWYDSARMERDPKADNDRIVAFTIRDQLIDVVLLCAEIIGGFSHVLTHSVNMRRFWTSAETFDQYLAEFSPKESEPEPTTSEGD